MPIGWRRPVFKDSGNFGVWSSISESRHGVSLLAPGFDQKNRYFTGPQGGLLTKDAHEVFKIEPACAGCRGQPRWRLR